MPTDNPDTSVDDAKARHLPPEHQLEHLFFPTFIGFATLEDWLNVADPTLPTYLLPIVERGVEQGGLRIDTLVVICQQLNERGHVHYCRLRAADLTRCFGDPFDTDWRDREAAWRSLAVEVTAELCSRNLTLLSATIAPPRSLRLLEGRSDRIRFDAVTRRFTRTSGSSAPAES